MSADELTSINEILRQGKEVETAEGRWYTMRIQPYRTMDNVIEGAVLTFVDITAVRKLHEALRVNEERLRVALNAASIAVFNQDLDLRYTWIQATNTGFSSEPIIGKTDADLFSEQEAAELTIIKQQVLASGEGTRQNVRITAAGKCVVFDLTIEPLRDSSNNIVGITCASLDVTGQQGRERTDACSNGASPSSGEADNT